jgi:uncharacterized protein YbjT (DUF2867 family)
VRAVEQRSAVLLGAEGLIGKELLYLLLDNKLYEKVTVFVQKTLPIQHEKLRQIRTSFDDLKQYEKEFEVDHVFCCIGSTMKQSGTKAQFLKADYEYPLAAAKCAESQKARSFLAVTSIGANLRSPFFYIKVKGQAEEDICQLYIRSTHFFRPSVLIGKRERIGLYEKAIFSLMRLFSFAFVGKYRKYKPIKCENVAKAMVAAALVEQNGVHVHESDEIFNGNCNEVVNQQSVQHM